MCPTIVTLVFYIRNIFLSLSFYDAKIKNRGNEFVFVT